MRETIRELLLSIRSHFSRKNSRTFSVYYSCETDEKAYTSSSYYKVKAAALHAVFCGPETLACADDLPLPGDFNTLHPPAVRFNEVAEGLEQHNADIIENAVTKPVCSGLSSGMELAGVIPCCPGADYLHQ